MRADKPIVIAGGGTGGHVYPGLALAHELRRRRPARPLEWIGARGGLEERLVPREGLPLTALPMSGLARMGAARRIVAVAQAAWATTRLAARFGSRRPSLIVGVGGFASGPAVLAGALARVPTLILEQNAVPGGTNRFLSRVASATAASFAECATGLSGRVVVTGNPVRDEVRAIAERPAGPLRAVLGFGGSRGAHGLNDAWCAALPLLADLPLHFVLQTGEADLERVREAAQRAGADAEVHAFLFDLPTRLAAADLVVARAGATTVAELTAAGRASILVPFPFAAHDHQRANARALANRGAALVVDQAELGGEKLAALVRGLALDPARLDEMSRAARRLGRPDAARHVADLADELAGGEAA
ncbi:MAG: undecaprenyldiphospho-muramoylpentapeptide beta-N-acetylglucosaminyltransferase [Acidobacteria bacterium]|nr:undecaprenyldiphospho-muramoylpentapeptide beta-N-acetylglucosaminyltransferase [Acidobacteriota bacterium]